MNLSIFPSSALINDFSFSKKPFLLELSNNILVTSTVMGRFSAIIAYITRKIEIPGFAERRNISQLARQIITYFVMAQ